MFGSRKKKKANMEEVAVAIGVALDLHMHEVAAAAGLAIHAQSGSTGRLTIKRIPYSPWRDIRRARSMERL